MREETNQKYTLVATISFIVGFGLAWLITENKISRMQPIQNTQAATTTSEQPANSEASTTSSESANYVTVSDQSAGTEVNLDKVVLQNAGWVVIHEDDNGQPGRILGAQLFDPGTWSGKVELLRGTLPGKIYYAMIHSDNGERAFDPKKDAPLTDQGGAPIMQMFKTLPESGSGGSGAI